MINTLDDFVREYSKICEMGWIDSHRSSSTGIGKTLEDLLGIPENNLNSPDFGEYELKSCRYDAGSMLSMFTLSPLPRGANTRLRLKYGYSSGVYDNSEKVIHSTLSSIKFTDIADTGHSLKVTCLDTGVYIESEEGLEDIYWTYARIRNAFENKYKNKFIYAKAESKCVDGKEQFRFVEAYEVSGFNIDSFISLLKKGIILVDLRIGQYHSGKNKGKTHDHGTGFRIKEIDQPLLFTINRKIV